MKKSKQGGAKNKLNLVFVRLTFLCANCSPALRILSAHDSASEAEGAVNFNWVPVRQKEHQLKSTQGQNQSKREERDRKEESDREREGGSVRLIERKQEREEDPPSTKHT